MNQISNQTKENQMKDKLKECAAHDAVDRIRELITMFEKEHIEGAPGMSYLQAATRIRGAFRGTVSRR
jgi:hypothetical protein